MSSRNINADHIHLYSDTMHAIHMPHRTRSLSKTPPTVIDYTRPSWLDNEAAVARYVLCELICEESTNINGHRVQRTDAFSRVSFHVNGETTDKGTLKRFSLKETIMKVST